MRFGHGGYLWVWGIFCFRPHPFIRNRAPCNLLIPKKHRWFIRHRALKARCGVPWGSVCPIYQLGIWWILYFKEPEPGFHACARVTFFQSFFGSLLISICYWFFVVFRFQNPPKIHPKLIKNLLKIIYFVCWISMLIFIYEFYIDLFRFW